MCGFGSEFQISKTGLCTVDIEEHGIEWGQSKVSTELIRSCATITVAIGPCGGTDSEPRVAGFCSLMKRPKYDQGVRSR